MAEEAILKEIANINKENGKKLRGGLTQLNLNINRVVNEQKASTAKLTGMVANLIQSNRSVFKGTQQIAETVTKVAEEEKKDKKEEEKRLRFRTTKRDKELAEGEKKKYGLFAKMLGEQSKYYGLWKRYEDRKEMRLNAEDRQAKNKVQQKGLDLFKDAGKSFKAGDVMKGVVAGLKGIGATIAGGILAAVTAGWKAVSAALPTALKEGVKGAAKGAVRMIPLAGAVLGIAEAIADGISGWTNSENWGVTKLSGFLGGFFAGDGAGGILNAFKNAGKWAGIGATAGLFLPPIGPIVGGLIGAALGAVLGWVGGKKLAEGFDSLGNWFADKWQSLVIEPIGNLIEALAPDWLKNMTFTLDDFWPPNLKKLFDGTFLKIDVPEFKWYNLFPEFMQDYIRGAKKEIAKGDKFQNWYDFLPLPQFLFKFFKGEYEAGKDKFEWKHLLPKFIQDILAIDAAGTKEVKSNWDKEWWKKLLPKFLVQLMTDTKVEVTEEGKQEFTMKNLMSMKWWAKMIMPTGLYRILYERKKAKASGEEFEFNWSALIPDWLKPAIASFQGLSKQYKDSKKGKEGLDLEFKAFDFGALIGDSLKAMIDKVKKWVGEFFTFDIEAVTASLTFPNPFGKMIDSMTSLDFFKGITRDTSYKISDHGAKAYLMDFKSSMLGVLLDMKPTEMRSGGLVQSVKSDQVPAILHANEIVLAENSAKLFLQAAQMFARPEYTNAIKDLSAMNKVMKTETTDALMQAGAMMGSGDGATTAMMQNLASTQAEISNTLAQLPEAVMSGANRGTYTGASQGGFTNVSRNPHEKKPKH